MERGVSKGAEKQVFVRASHVGAEVIDCGSKRHCGGGGGSGRYDFEKKLGPSLVPPTGDERQKHRFGKRGKQFTTLFGNELPLNVTGP